MDYLDEVVADIVKLVDDNRHVIPEAHQQKIGNCLNRYIEEIGDKKSDSVQLKKGLPILAELKDLEIIQLNGIVKQFQEKIDKLKTPWGTIGDYYTGNPEMEKKKKREQEILDRLGLQGQATLFEKTESTESTEKREDFFKRYAQRLEEIRALRKSDPIEKRRMEVAERIVLLERAIKKAEDEKANYNDAERIRKLDELIAKRKQELITLKEEFHLSPPIEMQLLFNNQEDFLSYAAAIDEENKSRKFRTAVLLKATMHFDGPEFEPPLDITIGGASSTGKTYATKLLIESLCKKELLKRLKAIYESINGQEPKTLHQSLMVLRLISYAIEEIERAKNPDEVKRAFMALFNDNTATAKIETLVELKKSFEKGNDVISIDGSNEREMSHVYQVMLQGALSLHYQGVEDLHTQSKKLKVKGLLKRAALVADGEPPFSLAIPNTFASKIVGRNEIETNEGRTPIAAFVEADSVQTAISADNRAFKKDSDTPFTATDIKMNNTNIGCESKKRKAKVAGIIDTFEQGYNKSKAAFERAQASGVDAYLLNNQIVHVKKSQTGEWRICDLENPKYDLKLNKVDFEEWKKQKSKAPNQTPDLMEWYNKNKAENKLQGILITKPPPALTKRKTLADARSVSSPLPGRVTSVKKERSDLSKSLPTDIQMTEVTSPKPPPVPPRNYKKDDLSATSPALPIVKRSETRPLPELPPPDYHAPTPLAERRKPIITQEELTLKKGEPKTPPPLTGKPKVPPRRK